MTTDAQTFAKLLLTFQPIYDSSDETIYIIQYVPDNDMPIVFDEKGEPITCDTCNKQLTYDSGDMTCDNSECESNQWMTMRHIPAHSVIIK